jgi:2-polyprenyl-3-methyl-5-hydroxy-6-metoxy-1,4-benzoquinol methylase
MHNPKQLAHAIVAQYAATSQTNKPDYYRYHKIRFAAMLTLVLSLPGKRVLEIGVNPGQFTEMLVNAGYDVYGTDIFPDDRAAVWKRLGVDVRRWNIDTEAPPYEPGMFDIIIFSEVIEHLANPPLAALEQFSTLLVPGGHLVVSTPNQFYFKSRMRTLFDVLLWLPFDHAEEFERWAMLRSDARYYTHSRLFSMQQLAWMAKASQFDVVSEEYHAAYEPVGIEWARFVRAPHRWIVKIAIAIVTALLWKTRSMILIALKKNAH